VRETLEKERKRPLEQLRCPARAGAAGAPRYRGRIRKPQWPRQPGRYRGR